MKYNSINLLKKTSSISTQIRIQTLYDFIHFDLFFKNAEYNEFCIFIDSYRKINDKYFVNKIVKVLKWKCLFTNSSGKT